AAGRSAPARCPEPSRGTAPGAAAARAIRYALTPRSPMSLEPDLLIDRRRLKRRLGFWRAAAVLLGALALFALFGLGDEVPGAAGVLGRGHVARLPVTGFISDDRRVIEALDRAARNDAVRALIVAIDSPGGSVAGG